MENGYFSENPTQDQRGSNPGRMHDWRGSQALYPLRHVPFYKAVTKSDMRIIENTRCCIFGIIMIM